MEQKGVEKAIVEGMVEEVEIIEIYPDYLQITWKSFDRMEAGNLGQQTFTYPIERQGIRAKKQAEKNSIISLMKENPEITAKQIASATGMGISAVEYKIRSLKKEGKIKYQGSGGKGTWIVRKKNIIL